MTLRTRLLAGALAAALVLVVPALAAPDKTGTLSAAAPVFTWEGAPQITHGAPVYEADARQAIPCKTPARPCEYVLLNLLDAGKLVVKVEGEAGTGGDTDPDLYFYESDAQGTQGKAISSSANSGPDSITYKAPKAGYYLALVDYYHGFNSGYKGTATFTAATPAAPPATTPPAAAPPTQTPNGTPKPAHKPSKKAACQKKAKKIKNAKKRKKALARCKKIKG
jgi:hypothetical protein